MGAHPPSQCPLSNPFRTGRGPGIRPDQAVPPPADVRWPGRVRTAGAAQSAAPSLSRPPASTAVEQQRLLGAARAELDDLAQHHVVVPGLVRGLDLASPPRSARPPG